MYWWVVYCRYQFCKTLSSYFWASYLYFPTTVPSFSPTTITALFSTLPNPTKSATKCAKKSYNVLYENQKVLDKNLQISLLLMVAWSLSSAQLNRQNYQDPVRPALLTKLSFRYKQVFFVLRTVILSKTAQMFFKEHVFCILYNLPLTRF